MASRVEKQTAPRRSYDMAAQPNNRPYGSCFIVPAEHQAILPDGPWEDTLAGNAASREIFRPPSAGDLPARRLSYAATNTLGEEPPP